MARAFIRSAFEQGGDAFRAHRPLAELDEGIRIARRIGEPPMLAAAAMRGSDLVGRGHGTAAAASQGHTELQVLPEMVDGIANAAEHVSAEDVAGDAHDQANVRSFVDGELDRHARIGAAENRRTRALLRLAMPGIMSQPCP